jgi:polysaccharide deacetylase family protein (PEP-CTERM system associated)
VICLTFDIEERFHSHLNPATAPRKWELYDRIAGLIDWVRENKKSATFFVVGELAERYPTLISRMVNAGFEVACHSHSHLKIDECGEAVAKEEIYRSKNVLEDITGVSVYGYRAPSWSAHYRDDWLWEYLISLGFHYDSSLFPFPTHLYGSFENPVSPFWIRKALLEIPPSVFMLGKIRVPYGGGAYFRLYPLGMTHYFLQQDIASGKQPVLYFHPWDFEISQELLERKLINKFIGNFNVKPNWRRFIRIIDRLPTMTMYERCKAIMAKPQRKEICRAE